MPVRSVGSTATPSRRPALPPSRSRPVGAHARSCTHGVHRHNRHEPVRASIPAPTLAHEFRFLVRVLSAGRQKGRGRHPGTLEPVFIRRDPQQVATAGVSGPGAGGRRAVPDPTGCAPPRTCAMLSTLPPHWSTTPPPLAGDAFSREPKSRHHRLGCHRRGIRTLFGRGDQVAVSRLTRGRGDLILRSDRGAAGGR